MSTDLLRFSSGFYGIKEVDSVNTVAATVSFTALQSLSEATVTFTSNGESENNQTTFNVANNDNMLRSNTLPFKATTRAAPRWIAVTTATPVTSIRVGFTLKVMVVPDGATGTGRSQAKKMSSPIRGRRSAIRLFTVNAVYARRRPPV